MRYDLRMRIPPRPGARAVSALCVAALLSAAAYAAGPRKPRSSAAGRRSRPMDFKPRWRDGLSWRVAYEITSPSPAATLDPAPMTRRETWDYTVARSSAPGAAWLLTVRESPRRGEERYELLFTEELRVLKAFHRNHWGEPYEQLSDADAGGFRLDRVSAPLLDWPDWESGRVEVAALVFRLTTSGYASFEETLRWLPDKPWWSAAERRQGALGMKAALLE